MSDRPTFKWKEQEVRAAGMLFFVNGENNVKLFLMRKPSKQWENTYWEDLGGKTDNRDHSYEETAIREVVEECNNSVFSNEDTFDTCCEKIRMLLQHKPYEMFYCPKSKYLLYKVELDKAILNLKMSRFKRIESCEQIPHYFRWKTKPYYKSVHPRIRSMKNVFV